MTFSGALTLTDLNDFITPSQACIKPVEQINPPKHPAAASTEIRVDSGGAYYEVAAHENVLAEEKLEQAQINLNDCLACSGCITSAESVLITLQSHTEVLNFLQSNPGPSSPSHKVAVLSIAPQTLASLAASSSNAQISLRQALRRIQSFCKNILGFDHVYDTTFARHIALLEHAQEFIERKNAIQQDDLKLPMLASACPGWVCYAEKTHKEMLPFVARTKSPQQAMGTLVKEWLGGKWGKTPDQIYHVSVMPCYDKKLEASRQDFYNEIYSTRDVDCVITTGELEVMMRDKNWDFSIPVVGELDDPSDSDFALPELVGHPGTSSGSYLHSLINSLTESSTTPLDLTVRTVRTSDYEEYTLTEQDTGQVVFKGAKCYGFRNLQNVVRKVGREVGIQVGRGAAGKLGGGLRGKRKSSADKVVEKRYDYVEVMACPGGCVNGGGQLKPPKENEERYWKQSELNTDGSVDGGVLQNAKWGDKEWTKLVEKAYWHDLPTPPLSPKLSAVRSPAEKADDLAARVLVDLCWPEAVGEKLSWGTRMSESVESRRRSLFRTQYHAVESDVIGLAVKW